VTVDLLARLGAKDVTTVADAIRAAHEGLSEGQCMAWRHKMKHPDKEGGCDVHPVEAE
jgi:hypothetical protein